MHLVLKTYRQTSWCTISVDSLTGQSLRAPHMSYIWGGGTRHAGRKSSKLFENKAFNQNRTKASNIFRNKWIHSNHYSYTDYLPNNFPFVSLGHSCMSVSFPQICDVRVLNHELNFYHNVLISWLSFYVHFCKYDSLYSCSLTRTKEMRVTLVRQFMYGFLTCGIKQV